MSPSKLARPEADAPSDQKASKLLQTFRHRNISASVFENESKNGGTFLTASLQRAYKDGEEFKHSSSFTRDEIPVARHVLERAWEFMLDAESK